MITDQSVLQSHEALVFPVEPVEPTVNCLSHLFVFHLSVSLVSPVCVSGWLVLGASRLKSGVLRPLFDDEVKEVELQEVTVHRRFVSDSASLFLIYFLQLVVMAMYLSQEQLKLVPLLTVVFAFGR